MGRVAHVVPDDRLRDADERDEEQDDEDHHLHEEVEAVVVEDVGVRVVRVVDPAEEDLE